MINDYEYLTDNMGLIFVGEHDDQDNHHRVLRSDHRVKVMQSEGDAKLR